MNGREASSSSTHSRHFGRAVGHAAEAELRDLHARLAEPHSVHRIVPFRLRCAHHRTFRRLAKARGVEGRYAIVNTRAGWDFWIDRGGTFTDVIGRDPQGRLHRAQASVREPGLRRRRGRGDPPPSRARRGRADPGGRDRRRQDGHDRRDQCAARAARRAHAARDDARLSRRARDRLPGAPEDLRPQHRQARAALFRA